MGVFDTVKKSLGKPSSTGQPQQSAQPPAPQPEEAPLVIPEVRALDVIAQYQDGSAPRLLDCREPYEWNQVRIPGSLHIPMNQIPVRLQELDKDAEWIVVCAHGHRSYGVAGYLIQNGYKASSLAGGVTDWWMRGGQTESDYR